MSRWWCDACERPHWWKVLGPVFPKLTDWLLCLFLDHEVWMMKTRGEWPEAKP
jgi:hypothetical protein